MNVLNFCIAHIFISVFLCPFANETVSVSSHVVLNKKCWWVHFIKYGLLNSGANQTNTKAPCTRSLDSMIPGSFFTRIEFLIACRWSRVQRNLHAHEPSGSDWICCSTPPTPVGGTVMVAQTTDRQLKKAEKKTSACVLRRVYTGRGSAAPGAPPQGGGAQAFGCLHQHRFFRAGHPAILLRERKE